MDRPSASTLNTALNIPLPHDTQDGFLDPPRASFLASEQPSIRDSYTPSNAGTNSSPLLPIADKEESNQFAAAGETSVPPSKPKKRLGLWLLVGFVVLAIVVLAIILPVYFTVIKPKQHNSSTTTGSSSSSPGSGSGAGSGPVSGGTGNTTPSTDATTGGDGSKITTDDGSTFTYKNSFGGFWVSDPNDPFNNNAQPNSWTPPLNQSWTWGKDRVFGVNLGGLFVLEPFISPALYQKYPGTTDEWSLSLAMAADTASGGLKQLEDHYNTFVTEKDIAQIAGAGLNWIRLPIPFWAVDTWPGEPFLAKTSWKYIVRLLGWCRKYGIRVNLDLHTVPGSQNGYNHSGKGGQINFLNGVMGPQYKDVVPMFGIVNEALISTIGRPQLTSFYLEAHNMIRGITGIGEGKGPYISIHDGFDGLDSWVGFLSGSDRIALDTHPYFAFNGGANDDPIDTGSGATAGGVWPQRVCQGWAGGINASRAAFGVTIAGEFSNGFNDCGLFLKGTATDATTYGGDCSVWRDASTWSPAVKAGLQRFAMSSMDALQDFFFWTWKIGNSSVSGRVEAPLWSYQLGLENGFMPTDPRSASGVCQALGVSGPVFDGTFEPWQTGGVGAGTIVATAGFPWPPATISGAGLAASLPTYTPTGTIATLPPPTFTGATKTADVGNGWFNAQDTTGAPTTIAGCTYPDGWNAQDVAAPVACGV
ncbi:glycoside hydrolase superfamily [Infundibulicybe gibba]|nr:glycoside hydrolase superfamily [Infundibulicybe gibba]